MDIFLKKNNFRHILQGSCLGLKKDFFLKTCLKHFDKSSKECNILRIKSNLHEIGVYPSVSQTLFTLVLISSTNFT